jgi:hypothetical protein
MGASGAIEPLGRLLPFLLPNDQLQRGAFRWLRVGHLIVGCAAGAGALHLCALQRSVPCQGGQLAVLSPSSLLCVLCALRCSCAGLTSLLRALRVL